MNLDSLSAAGVSWQVSKGGTLYLDERRRPGPRRGPLAGVRVADFCWMGVGSVATRLLADFGAEVIKIEDRTRIDTPRKLPLYKDERARNFGEEVVGADPNKGGSVQQLLPQQARRHDQHAHRRGAGSWPSG